MLEIMYGCLESESLYNWIIKQISLFDGSNNFY